MWEILTQMQFAGNEVWRLVAFFAVILVALIAGRLARFLLARASAESNRGNRPVWWLLLLRALSRSAVLVAFAAGFAVATQLLQLPEGIDGIFLKISEILNAVAVGFVVYRMVDVIDHYLVTAAERTESKVDDVLAPLVGRSIRITVAVLVLLNMLQVLMEEDVMTIVAGLGVGGLAIALAGQDTIKNFFGAFVILGDRPFEIGDRIVVDGHDGPVVAVGFRSTKIRTLEGHLVTVPNSEIVNKTVQNIGKRPYIRRTMKIGVTYDTSPAMMRRALSIIQDVLDGHEGMDPELEPRVFFADFGDFSLNIVAIFWYHPPEYWDYTAFSEKVNIEILERFNDEGIEFAFPTQTIHVRQS